MNLLPCEVRADKAYVAGRAMKTLSALPKNGKGLELGVRPEFVSFAEEGVPVEVTKVSDAGRFCIVETRYDGCAIKLLVPEGEAIPEGRTHVKFDPEHTQIYENGWMIG
jgi:glycerol transport system ATP-binding protein